jgi:hypothetical protein
LRTSKEGTALVAKAFRKSLKEVLPTLPQITVSLRGQKLYDLRGVNSYKLNGDLVGHFSDESGAQKHLDKATDRLFPAS